MKKDKEAVVEELLEEPYSLIDIYPATISKEKRDLYFEVEDYFNSVILSSKGYVHILLMKESTLIQINGDDLYVTVYHPNEKVDSILKALVQSEGLFFRKTI